MIPNTPLEQRIEALEAKFVARGRLNRGLAFVVVLAAGLLSPALGFGNDFAVPYLFAAGEPAQASQFNENFAYVLDTMSAEDATLRGQLDAHTSELSSIRSDMHRLEYVTSGFALPGFDTVTHTAQCPDGKVAVAGGLDYTAGNAFYARCFALQESYPTSDGGWFVRARRHDFGGESAHCKNSGNWGAQIAMWCVEPAPPVPAAP